jgi:hypothetical protein
MNLLIADHYNNLVGRRDWLLSKTNIDVYAEWQNYLTNMIISAFNNNARVAVVGYVLHDCMGQLIGRLSAVARAYTVHVENCNGTRTYTLSGHIATSPEDLVRHL